MNRIKIDFEGSAVNLVTFIKKNKITGTVSASIVVDGPEMDLLSILSDLKKQDSYISAIKRHREITGFGLKESKDFVEKHLPNQWQRYNGC